MITDRISDTIVRIKNALKIKNKFVLIPYTKLNFQLLKLLKEKKLIYNFEIVNYKKTCYLNVFLQYKYLDNLKVSIINNFKIISKPSLKVYIKSKNIRKLINKREIYFVSTSQGIMDYISAYRNNLGGELLFSVS